MDPDESFSKAGDPLTLLGKEDLDRLSVDELKARVAALEAEIARTQKKITGAINHLSSAEALFRR
jgi:uncharacterized small protein (DUF1192 family)